MIAITTHKKQGLNPAELFALQTALQAIADNFNKENIIYIATLSKQSGVNEKFSRLKNNPLIKSLL